MTYRVEKDKWILYRHTSSFDMIKAVALDLKRYSKCSISKDDNKNLLEKLKELGYYKGRNPKMPLDSINHRINTLAYFMFGYKETVEGEKRFLFSPLGNLFLKHIDDSDKLSKIFLAMLWGIQFKHPHGGSSDKFNLYPFRLMFKLLSDKRLEGKLFASEVAYYVVFTESADEKLYEELVRNILEMRKWPDQEVARRFKEDEHALVNAVYEWDYYLSKLFQSAGVIERDEGELICELSHGKSTKRRLSKNAVRLSPEMQGFCSNLLSRYPFSEEPLNLDDESRLTIDTVKEIYNFFPEILLKEIGEEIDVFEISMLELPKLIEKYSKHEKIEDAYLFEDVLEKAFNMFYNVEAKRISGAGNPDVECLYTTLKKKFVVEAKSTQNKLVSLSSGRLAEHRRKIGGKYTIVITPNYVPAVKHDIETSDIVILMARTFSEFLYNNIINNVREIDYSEFDAIIIRNLGKDISRQVSDLTLSKFGIAKQ